MMTRGRVASRGGGGNVGLTICDKSPAEAAVAMGTAKGNATAPPRKPCVLPKYGDVVGWCA
jgi:hypothetical protein